MTFSSLNGEKFIDEQKNTTKWDKIHWPTKINTTKWDKSSLTQKQKKNTTKLGKIHCQSNNFFWLVALRLLRFLVILWKVFLFLTEQDLVFFYHHAYKGIAYWKMYDCLRLFENYFIWGIMRIILLKIWIINTGEHSFKGDNSLLFIIFWLDIFMDI